MTNGHPRPSGFTLVEILVVTAMVGLLASIAIPEFSRAELRARTAERATIMDSLERAINDVVLHQQALPVNSGTQWIGLANPPGPPGRMKRAFNWATLGWNWLPLVVEGNAYYSYSFVADDPNPKGKALWLSVTAEGDLDGDGVHSFRTDAFVGDGNGYWFIPDPVAANWFPPDPAHRDDPTNL